MQSRITKTFEAYHEALHQAARTHGTTLREHLATLRNNYPELKRFLRPIRPLLGDPNRLQDVKTFIVNEFGVNDDQIVFAAIDGDAFRETLDDFLVFGCAAYSVYGHIDINASKAEVAYRTTPPDRRRSLVGYLPVPLTMLGREDEDPFTAYGDSEQAETSSFHTLLMRMAEIRLAIDTIKDSGFKPTVMLLDYSISSTLMSNGQDSGDVDMVGYPFNGRELREQDVVIAMSRPYNEQLQVPHAKWPRLDEWVLASIFHGGPSTLSQLYNRSPYAGSDDFDFQAFRDKVKADKRGSTDASDSDVTGGKIFRDFNGKPAILAVEGQDGTVSADEDDGRVYGIREEYRHSWDGSINLFDKICDELFDKHNPDVLHYIDLNSQQPRMLTQRDLKFLISVGLRQLIELAWDHKVMLLGIAKESGSSYFSRNFLGVLKHHWGEPLPDDHRPSSDRLMLEAIPYIDPSLDAPWTTVEFDACFMTVAHRAASRDDKTRAVQGVRGNIVTPQPGLLARSVAQFYIKRDGDETLPLVGNVIFVDRLAHPGEDRSSNRTKRLETDKLGVIHPIVRTNSEETNRAQDAAMVLLDRLTRNLYPDVIGIPDALHRAEWGAKSVIQKVRPVVRSSIGYIRGEGIRKQVKLLDGDE